MKVGGLIKPMQGHRWVYVMNNKVEYHDDDSDDYIDDDDDDDNNNVRND